MQDDESSPGDPIVERRSKVAGLTYKGHGPWALALSGGGIRSATFCLGLVRGLAGNKLLRKMDYLSTVSGGGYLGASLGRLYNANTPAEDVEAGVARDDSMWLWWLRNNGRYLTPAGAKDLGFAAASIIRGVISTHLEIGVMITLMAALVLLPHFLVSVIPPVAKDAVWSYAAISALPYAWAWLLVLPIWVCIYQICAYWYARDRYSFGSVCLIVAAALGFGIAATALALLAASTASLLWYCGAALLAAPVLALVGVVADCLRPISISAQRLARTQWLAYGLWGIVVFAAFLCLDIASWQLTRLYWGDELSDAVVKVGGLLVLIAAIGRLALPELQRWLATLKEPSINIKRLLNVIGLTLSALAAIFWTSLLSVLVFPPDARSSYWGSQLDALSSIPAILNFTIIVLGCLAYVMASKGSFDLLNLASLHNFYRARLERAYVSSGNCGGKGCRFPGSALDKVSRAATEHVEPLTESIDGDDEALEHYTPHRWGGPIHLINCCVNQTVDDRTGLYNADRKGVALTVSALGVEAGTHLPEEASDTKTLGMLSKWTAISGAAAGTGMGSQTSPGLAALLFMSGIRLGYWTQCLLRINPAQSQGIRALLARMFPKPLAIVAESLARFPGLGSPLWYVSDGGHFDNTGIYALLKRRPALIVAADCGADPNYLFGDLESLVRKAKIDFNAKIEFVQASAPDLGPMLAGIVGTPETIHPQLGNEWLVVGRIVYDPETADPDAVDRAVVGTLIVVKPRRLDEMPFDVVAYADRNQAFPQQTTGDQFFDEAQWEAYHQLGLLMGQALTEDLIEEAIEAATRSRGARLSSLKLAENPPGIDRAKAKRSKRAALTVRATVGAGLSLSLLVAAWQGFEQYRERVRAENQRYEERVADLHGKISDGSISILFEKELLSISRESIARRDGAIQGLQFALNEQCLKMRVQREQEGCLSLYKQVESLIPTRREPLYDYWFKHRYIALGQADEQPSATSEASSPVNDLEATSEAVAATGSMEVLAARAPASEGSVSFVMLKGRVAPPSCPEDIRVFTHIYDEQSRPVAKNAGERLRVAVGARWSPVENVVATAERSGRPSTFVWDRPTLIYPPALQACVAEATTDFGDAVSRLPTRTGAEQAVELWLPPRSLNTL